MKKLFLLFALVVCAFSSNAQGPVTFTLVKAPCDSDGILVANYSGTPPYNVLWEGGSTRYSYYKEGITGPTDTLYHYNGGMAEAAIYIGTGGTGMSVYMGKSYYRGAPPFDFKFSSTPAILPSNGTASVVVTGGVRPYSYYWFRDYYIDSFKGTGNPITLPPGVYGVAVTDAVGCWFSSLNNNGWDNNGWDTIKGYSSTIHVNGIPGRSEHFSLFPNPATDVIHISGVNAATIILCNALGEIVARKEDSDHLSIAALPAGVYIISVYDKQYALLKQEKIVKQ